MKRTAYTPVPPDRTHTAAGETWIPLPRAARQLGKQLDSVVWLIHHGYLVGYLSPPRWFVRADSLTRYQRWAKRSAA